MSLFKELGQNSELWGQVQLTVKGSSNQTLPQFKESILGYVTVGQNIIATIKMRNNFCYPLIMVILAILQ